MASIDHDNNQYYSGLAFIWRLGGKFSGTRTTLNSSSEQLNTHLIKVDAKAESNASIVHNHEIRLVDQIVQ